MVWLDVKRWILRTGVMGESGIVRSLSFTSIMNIGVSRDWRCSFESTNGHTRHEVITQYPRLMEKEHGSVCKNTTGREFTKFGVNKGWHDKRVNSKYFESYHINISTIYIMHIPKKAFSNWVSLQKNTLLRGRKK